MRGIASMEQAANLEPTNIQVLQALTQMLHAFETGRPMPERVAKRATTFNTGTRKKRFENYGSFSAAAEEV